MNSPEEWLVVSWSASVFKSLALELVFPKVCSCSQCPVYMYCVYTLVCMYCLCYDLYTSSGKDSEEVMKSLENIKNSKNLKDFTLRLRQLPSNYMAIICGCFQSRTLEKLKILVEEVRVCYNLCPIFSN